MPVPTWNLREFGKSKMGFRGMEPLFYIAEIIDRFDLGLDESLPRENFEKAAITSAF